MFRSISPILKKSSCVFSTSASLEYSSSLYIFDRNVKRMQRDRAANEPNHKDYEYVKSEVGYRVADRIFDIKRSFNNILDLGCQRGYVSKHLTKDTVNKIHMFEMSEDLLVTTKYSLIWRFFLKFDRSSRARRMCQPKTACWLKRKYSTKRTTCRSPTTPLTWWSAASSMTSKLI